ncbi:2016_t:CDS:2 [Paraglomus occultum]|uniref:Peroxin-7 n=1 Tax=Paraglomus occultum TaxID=144539 RepID=A0A9N8W9F5_9GLOM|nr:2016_t:CDS:2 [Paraglomus occultum]
MLTFKTVGYNGYAVQFSPFVEHKLACASAANFGLVGNGRLFILNLDTTPNGMSMERMFDTQDGLFDCSWSEINENQIVTASGDGSVKLWDITLAEFPIRNWKEHQREVFSVHWNYIKKDTIVSGSWDQTIKLWHPEHLQSLSTFTGHTACIYSTLWSPYNADLFGSVSGDRTFRLWDIKTPRPVTVIPAHQDEILSFDWNKYRNQTIVTGSVDTTLRIWDLRFPDREVKTLQGHQYAVRRVKYSPHSGDIIASASYDMTMRVWNTAAMNPLLMLHNLHTEFVLGIDFNLYVEGQIVTCAWDEMVHVIQLA